MRWSILLLVSLGMTSLVGAQYHTTPWSFSAGGMDPVLGRIDRGGTITSILTRSQLPANVSTGHAAVEQDNRTYVLVAASPGADSSLLRVDITGVIVETIRLQGIRSSAALLGMSSWSRTAATS